MSKHDGLMLRDPQSPPDDGIIADELGKVFPSYQKFVAGVAERGIEQRWQFYRDGGAWLAKGVNVVTGPRGGRKEIPMYWLSIWEDSFRVTVYFKHTDRQIALEAPVSDRTVAQIAAAERMGKVNQFGVEFVITNDDRLSDVLTLIEQKRDYIRR